MHSLQVQYGNQSSWDDKRPLVSSRPFGTSLHVCIRKPGFKAANPAHACTLFHEIGEELLKTSTES